jgi:tRNA(Ile)-lysidine synthase
MRALRGAGLRGLGGIRPLNGAVIRPLLDVSRAEVLTFLRERGQGVCDDATNRDPRVFRNRVRHEVLPWLETTLAPRATEALARAARLAADEDEQLERDATGSVHSFVLAEGEGLAFDVAELARLPLALRRRVVIRSAERVGGRPFTAAAVERVLDLVSRGRGQVDVPGVRASIVGARLELRQAPRRRAHERATGDGAFVGELNVPGVVSLPGGGRIEAATSRPVPAHDQGPMTAALDAAAVRAPMLVRFRWTGARFQPLGMSGHKKVQDLFVDRKVPRAQRDKVPLVVDADGGILWVAGHAIADRARVTPATTSVLLLKYLR